MTLYFTTLQRWFITVLSYAIIYVKFSLALAVIRPRHGVAAVSGHIIGVHQRRDVCMVLDLARNPTAGGGAFPLCCIRTDEKRLDWRSLP